MLVKNFTDATVTSGTTLTATCLKDNRVLTLAKAVSAVCPSELWYKDLKLANSPRVWFLCKNESPNVIASVGEACVANGGKMDNYNCNHCAEKNWRFESANSFNCVESYNTGDQINTACARITNQEECESKRVGCINNDSKNVEKVYDCVWAGNKCTQPQDENDYHTSSYWCNM